MSGLASARWTTKAKLLCYCALAVTVHSFTLGDSVSFAQIANGGQTPQSYQYRRIFVPVDTPEKWPIGSERYVPIADEEFGRLIEQSTNLWQDDRAAEVRFTDVAYTANLTKENVLAGSTEAKVHLLSSTPQILSLTPLNLVVTSAYWAHEPKVPLYFALWSQGPDQNNQLGIVVKQSSTLHFEWQSQAKETSDNGLEFLLETPPATSQIFSLTIPSNQGAFLNTGVLIKTENLPQNLKRWVFQLGPSGVHRLRISQSKSSRIDTPSMQVSQASEYKIDRQGLSLTTRFRVDVSAREAEKELRFAISAGIKILSLTIDQKNVAWQVNKTASGTQLTAKAVASPAPQKIEIHGLSQIVFDEPWQLPSIRLLGAIWSEGTSRLQVSPAIELLSIVPQRASLEHVVGLKNTATEELYRLQEWNEDASLEVIVGKRTARLSAQTATTVDLDPADIDDSDAINFFKLDSNETKARTISILSCQGRPAYQIAGVVSNGWSIEAIKTSPANALREWHVYRKGSQDLFRIQLNRPLKPGIPLRIECDTRATREDSLLPAIASELIPIRFTSVELSKQLLLLRSQKRGQLELPHGLESARVQLDTLADEEASLLPETIDGALLDLSRLAADSPINLLPRPAQYQADVGVEVNVFPDSLVHQFLVTITPTSGTVSELVIGFDDPLPETAQWEVVGHAGAIVAQRLEQASSDPSKQGRAVQYLIRLPVAIEGPFQLRANYTSPATESQKCNLIEIPYAMDWRGHLMIRGPLKGTKLHDRGWTPIAAPTEGSLDSSGLPVIGMYRLEPNRAGIGLVASNLIITREEGPTDISNIFSRFVDVQTSLSDDGTAIYVATYYLENSGATGTEFELPAQAKLQGAWINQQQLDPRELLADERICRFHFPDHRRFPTITVQYVTQANSLSNSSEFQPALLSCKFTIEYGRWTLWTPEHIAVSNFNSNQTLNDITWSSRLLGPLKRLSREGLFNPLRAEDWRQFGSTRKDIQSAQPTTETILQTLISLLEEGDDQRWGGVLLAVANSLENGGKLTLDRSAFEDLGISVESRLSDLTQSQQVQDNAANSRRANPLERYGLSFVTTPNLTILTSLARTSQWREQLRPSSIPGVLRVSSKKLALRLERLAAGKNRNENITNTETDLVDVSDWLAYPNLVEWPWNVTHASVVPGIGRQAAMLEFTESPPTVTVQQVDKHHAIWHVIWLLTLVLSRWRLVCFPRYFALSIALAAAMCLVVPLTWLILPQAVFLGLLSSAGLQFFFPKAATSTSKSSPFRLATRTAFIVLSFGSFLAPEITFAQAINDTQQVPPRKPPQKIHRLLLPIDADGNKQSDEIYLSEAFLQALLQNQGDPKHGGAQCAVQAVQYRGALPIASPATITTGESWTILLDIESFVSRGRIFFPFKRDEADWISSSHRLNGFPVKLHWEEGGNGFTVDFESVGTHRLELSIRPKISYTLNRAKILLHTPAISGAKLSLTSLSGFSDLAIPTAGELDIDRSTHQLKTFLSASDTLEITWSATSNSATKFPSLGSVDQLSWLRVEPTSAVLDVQLHLKNTDSRRFLLEASSNLKLVPPKEGSIIESAKYLPEQRHTLEIILKQKPSETSVIPLQFQLQRTVSIGRIVYPWVQLLGFNIDRSLLAVSVRAGLSYDESLLSDAISLQATDFLKEWNTTQEPPLYAYALGRERIIGSLHIWPDPRRLSAQQSMKIHCQLTKTQVTYEAMLNEVVGNWLTYRLQVPEQLQVTEVLVQPSSREKAPLRWRRVSKSQVAVILSQAQREPHLLTLRGNIKTTAEGRVSIPKISLLEANSSEIRIDLFREPNVLVSWVEPDRSPEKITTQNITRGPSGNLVGRYRWHKATAANISELLVERNHQQYDADLVITLAPGPSGWSGTAHTVVKVREGMLDELSFTVADAFQPPYRIEPLSLGTVSEQVDNTGRRQVSVQLQQPLERGQELTFHLTGAINLTANQQLMAPDLQLKDASRGQRYILLPTVVDNKSIYWNWGGLTPESLPKELEVLLDSHLNTRAFRIEQDSFHAYEQSYQGTLQNAIWRYALVSGVLDQEGRLSATAELVLQPGRATHCTLQLPPNAVLTQLIAGDTRVRREKTSNGNWRIPLGPPYLPRRIIVSYESHVKTSADQFELRPPVLMIDDRPLPAPETRWKLHSVGQLRLAEPMAGRPLSSEQYSRAALQLSLHTLTDARLLALELPKWEGRAWFAPWQRRTQQAWEQWHLVEPISESLAEFSSTALGANDTDENSPSAWSILFEQLGTSNANSEHPSKTTDYPLTLLGQISPYREGSEEYFISDADGHLILKSPPLAPGIGWRWFFAIVMVIASLKLTEQIGVVTDSLTRLRQQPSLLLIAVGLLWWLLLSPSIIGLLLVVCTLLTLVFQRSRKAWQRQFQTTNSQLTNMAKQS